jgi:hypothetical protein
MNESLGLVGTKIGPVVMKYLIYTFGVTFYYRAQTVLKVKSRLIVPGAEI